MATKLEGLLYGLSNRATKKRTLFFFAASLSVDTNIYLICLNTRVNVFNPALHSLSVGLMTNKTLKR